MSIYSDATWAAVAQTVHNGYCCAGPECEIGIRDAIDDWREAAALLDLIAPLLLADAYRAISDRVEGAPPPYSCSEAHETLLNAVSSVLRRGGRS